MKAETIEYKDGDLTLRRYLAYDDKKSGKRPGVLAILAPGSFQASLGTSLMCDLIVRLSALWRSEEREHHD